MEEHDRIEDNADDGVSGRKERPLTTAAKNQSPDACYTDNPAREHVEIIRMLADRPQGEDSGDAAGEEEWVVAGHVIWVPSSRALTISMRLHRCR